MKNKNNKVDKKVDEYEMKGRACWPSHYPNSPYIFLNFHSQMVFGSRRREWMDSHE